MSSKEKLIATIAVLRELKKLHQEETENKKKTRRRCSVKPHRIRCESDIEFNLLSDIHGEDEMVFGSSSSLNVNGKTENKKRAQKRSWVQPHLRRCESDIESNVLNVKPEKDLRSSSPLNVNGETENKKRAQKRSWVQPHLIRCESDIESNLLNDKPEEDDEKDLRSSSPLNGNGETENKKRARKRSWVQPHLIRICDSDVEANLLNDIHWEDDEKDFGSFSPINVHAFEKVLRLVHGSLKKTDTCMRAALTPRIKLAITLRYLSKGGSLKALEYLTRVSRNAISAFLPIVLSALYDALKVKYLKVPDSEEEWKNIADDFDCIWQFPHIMGALDGRHIRVRAPAKSASCFYNTKGFFTIVLFALVDAHSRFIFIDVGCNGKATDSTIYQDGFLCKGLENGHLNIPKEAALVSTQGNKVPYFFIGNDEFRLDKHLMKPYKESLQLNIQQEVFNYRICRASIVVERAFGRLGRRFNVFNRPIDLLPSTINLIVKTCCVLHNCLTKTNNTPMPIDVEVDIQPETFSSIEQQEYNTYKHDACRVRDELSRYLIADGNVDFQWRESC